MPQMTALSQRGRITRCRDRIAERTKEFYKKFYYSDLNNSKVLQTDEDTSTIESILQVLDITLTEVERAIHQLTKKQGSRSIQHYTRYLERYRPPYH